MPCPESTEWSRIDQTCATILPPGGSSKNSEQRLVVAGASIGGINTVGADARESEGRARDRGWEGVDGVRLSATSEVGGPVVFAFGLAAFAAAAIGMVTYIAVRVRHFRWEGDRNDDPDVEPDAEHSAN